MSLDKLYKCLGDIERIRILNLLKEGPLCVCHLQEILPQTQVKTSKQLLYLKKMGLVIAKREANWMIYRLREPLDGLLQANLNYLTLHSQAYPMFLSDVQQRKLILQHYALNNSACPIKADDGCT
mgnify:CR=1 FL=1